MAVSSPAHAAEGDGVCSPGDVCLYWGHDFNGSMTSFYRNKYSHQWWKFQTPGSGQGEYNWHNVPSAYNNAKSGVRIYRFENGSGEWEWVPPKSGKKLTTVRNLNASHYFDFGG